MAPPRLLASRERAKRVERPIAGQAVLETVIVFPLLVLCAATVVELARLTGLSVVVHVAAIQSARCFAVQEASIEGRASASLSVHTSYDAAISILSAVRADRERVDFKVEPLQGTPHAGCHSAVVRVTYWARPSVPIVSRLLVRARERGPAGIPITARAVTRIEYGAELRWKSGKLL